MASDVVGLLGLGLMGSALAERLISAGFAVCGYDCDANARHRLGQAGGIACEGLPALLEQCERMVVSLPTSQIVEEVLLQHQAHWRPGTVILDTTTGSPDDVSRIATKLAARGIAYVDGTVSGSSAQTRRGEVLMMLGGRDEDISRVRDLVQACAARWFHLGPSGAGARMKLVSNLVLGLNRAALAEGLALARAMQLDLQQTLQVLEAGMSYSRIMETKGEKMITQDYSVQARLAQHLKDVHLMLEEARQRRQPLPFSELHSQILTELVEQGLGDADNSAIQEFFLQPRSREE